MNNKTITTLITIIVTILIAPLWGQSWSKTFGSSKMEVGKSVQQTTDGGYIIVGTWLIKTDLLGQEEWINESISGKSGQQTNDGGYIILGSDLIKTDSNGNEEWNKTFDGEGYGVGNDVKQTSDGGYIITGYQTYIQQQDYVLILKVDKDGNQEWYKSYIGGQGHSTQQTSDGGYIIIGARRHSQGIKAWLIKTDSGGDTLWTKEFGEMWEMWSKSIQQTTDGGYIFAGSKENAGKDVWLIKTDKDGNEEWTQTFGGGGYDVGQSVQKTLDGGYIIFGHTNSHTYVDGFPNPANGWLIKTDSKGNEEWNHIIFRSMYGDYIYYGQQTTDGGYISVGEVRKEVGTSDGSDVWLIKTDSEGKLETSNTIKLPTLYSLSDAYPNPFNPTTTLRFDLPQLSDVTLTIFNMLGQKVKTFSMQSIPAGYHSVTWDATNDLGQQVGAGVYLYQLQTKDFVKTRKMVLLK